MTGRRRPLLLALAGALPQLAFIGWMLIPRPVSFMLAASSDADLAARMPALAFGTYGRVALVVVPVHVAAAAAVALIPRHRRTALWLVLGTLAGVAVTFLSLSAMALSWRGQF